MTNSVKLYSEEEKKFCDQKFYESATLSYFIWPNQCSNFFTNNVFFKNSNAGKSCFVAAKLTEE
jgi:hypothetical protein